MDRVIDPIDDFLKSTSPSYLAPNVPAPDMAMTGGQPMQNLPSGLIPTPAPAPAPATPTPGRVEIAVPPNMGRDVENRLVELSKTGMKSVDVLNQASRERGIAPSFSAPAGSPAMEPIRDPLEDILPKAAPAQPLGDLLFPRRPEVTPPPVIANTTLMGELGKGIMQGIYQTKEMGGGLMALAGEALNSASSVMTPIAEPVKDVGMGIVKSSQEDIERYSGAVPSYKNISGVQDALYYLSHGIGTLLPMIGMSMVSGGVGAAAGKALARNYVTTLAERMALQGIPRELINESVKQGLIRGVERGAMLGGYASSLAMEAGSITADMVNDNKVIDPLRVMMGAIPAAALDVLPEYSLAKRTGLLKRLGLSKAEAALAEEAAQKIPGSFLGRVGKEAGKQFLMEAPTEAMQSALERWAERKDLTSAESIDDYIDSFLIGGAGGALFGGLGGAFERPGKPGQVPPTAATPPLVSPPGAPAAQPIPPTPGPAAPTLPTPAPGMIPGREAIIQNPPEKTAGVNPPGTIIEPGRPVQPDTVDMEAWQAMKRGRWMDFIGQNIQPETLSQVEQIQRDMGLVVKDGKVFQVGPNGEAIPLSPEKEEAATWALTHRLRVVDDFLKFINQAPVTTETPKQITGGVNWIPGRPKTILRPGPGIEPAPGEGGFTAGQVQSPKVYVRTSKGNLALVRNPNIPTLPNLPQEGTLGNPPVTTPGVIPAPQPPPAPPQPAPGKAPVAAPTPAPSLGGPAWMKIGSQTEFFDDKSGKTKTGTIADIVYQGDPPQPSSVTVKSGSGKNEKTFNLRSDQVNEPTHAVRRKEYFSALQGLPAQQRKATIAGSKEFDRLLLQHADLFVDQGQIEHTYNQAQTDKQKAVATHEILNHARAEAGKVLKIQDVYNPVQRAENLKALQDHIQKERPAATGPETQSIAAGNLPMGKETVRKNGEWLDVGYDEESGKIILKDGRQFSVAPDEKVEVEQIRIPKEPTPNPIATEKPAPVPEAPKVPKSPSGPLLPDQARRLEEIRKENPEAAARIEKGNVAVGIQQHELARMGKAQQMRQGEMLPTPKAQEEIFPAMKGTEFTANLPQDWKNALKENQTGHAWLSFLAEKSPDESQRLLAKALLDNGSIRKQLEALPVTTFQNWFIYDSGKALNSSHYDPATNSVRLSETNFENYSNERAGSVVIHEILHGLTCQKMRLDPNLKFAVSRLRSEARAGLSEREQNIFRDNWGKFMESGEKIRSLGLTEHHADVYYGLQNEDEFLAEVFSSPHMQEYLKSMRAAKGIQGVSPKNLWDQFIEFLNHIFFGDKNHRSLLSQALSLGARISEAERSEQLRLGTGPLFEPPSLPQVMQDNIDALNHPAFPGNAAEDPKFDPYLQKYRFLIHVTDPDLKRWKEIGVLPYWLAKEYPEFAAFLQTQERREEKRSELKTERFKEKEPFTFLKGDILSKTEQALIAGDEEGRVWTDAKLIERFGLSPEGIAGYRAVRATLDGIFQTNMDRAEAAILDNARRTIDSAFDKLTHQIEGHKASEQKDVLLGLLRTAHDLPLSDEETTHLANLLGETQAATEKPLKTVKDKLAKIFNEILTEKDKAKLLTDYESAYEKAQASIGDIREVIFNALGGDVAGANLDTITKGLVTAYLRTERPANTLKQLREEFGKAKGYFPRDHGRGKYEIFVTQETFDDLGQPQKRVIWNHFYDQIQGTIAYKKLKQDPEFNQAGMEIGIRLHKEEPDSSFWRASLANLQRLTDNSIEELKRKGTITPEWADAMKFQILYELSDQFKARGAARHFIHRADYVISGYKTTDLNQVLNDYISGWAGMITKQDAAGEFLEAMKGIPKDKPKLKNYAFQYTENMLRNDERIDQVLGKMRGLVFTYFLGGSLRGGLVNSTQSLTMTIPWLAREVGWKGLRAEGLVLGSARDIAINRLSEAERRLLDDTHNKGATEAQYVNEVIREAGDRFGKTLGKVVTLLAKPFSFFETKNRQVAALSYFRAKMPDLLRTMTEEEAYQKVLPDAINFVNKTQFMMSKGNLPNWASGGDIGSQFFRTAYIFRKFNHNYLLSLRNSFRGPDGKVALDVIGRSLAYLVLLGGLPALPFLDDLLDEWEKIFGQPVRREIKRNLNAIGGPALEKMGLMGLPAIVGIDISGSLKMGIPFVGTPSESIFGVWAGLGRKFINAKDSAERGDVLRAIESASPAFLESMLKAYRMTEKGATTPTGKILFDEKGQPIKETTGEGIAQAFGFRPERLSEASRTHREFSNIESNFTNRRNDLYSRFRLAKTAEDRQAVVKDVQQYNLAASKYRGSIPMINAQSLRQSFISKPEKKYLLWGAQG